MVFLKNYVIDFLSRCFLIYYIDVEMFNFFKRSKKDPDASTSRETTRDKKSKEKDVKNTSPQLALNNYYNKKDIMYKNNLPIEKLFESAPQQSGYETSPKILTEFELRENNKKSAIVTGALVKPGDDDDDDHNNHDTNSETTNTGTTTPAEDSEEDKSEMDAKQINFNGAGVRRYDVVVKENRNSRNVKPCGHGTVAIQPRIPILTARRDSSGTPPESPKSDVRNPLKKCKNDDQIDESSDNNRNNKAETVSASMKIKLNLPNTINSPAMLALTDSITENVSSDTQSDSNDDVKYGITLSHSKDF